MKLKSILSVLIVLAMAGAFLAFDNPGKDDYGIDPSPVSVTGEVIAVINDSVSNSISKTGYLKLEPGKIVDSVQFVLYAKGEIDLDLFIGIKAFTFEYTPGNYLFKNYASVAGDSTTLTTNLDSAVSSVTYVATWTGAKLTGANTVYCRVDAASSGNDARDRNELKLWGIVYYRQ